MFGRLFGSGSAQSVHTPVADNEDDEEDAPLPTGKLGAVAANGGGICQPSSLLRKHIAELKSRNASRTVSPDRPEDFDRVMMQMAGVGDEASSIAACLASVLRVPLEEIPEITLSAGPGILGTPALAGYLQGCGRGWHQVPMCEHWRLPPHEDAEHWNSMLGILRGISPREKGLGHGVVARIRIDGTFTIVHDPHPDGEGLASPLAWLALLPPLGFAKNTSVAS